MMSRLSRIMVTVLLGFCLPLGAQQVVIDPSQIAASATNAAEQVDYMVEQLVELANLGDRLDKVRGFIDDVFGEGGAGGKTISILQDLGTLERMTMTYNSILKRTTEYAKRMDEMNEYRLSDVNVMLSNIRMMKIQMEMAMKTARHILSTLGFSKKEKKDEMEKIIQELEQDMEKTERIIEIEMNATVMAEGFLEAYEYIDDQLDPGSFVESRKVYGNIGNSSSQFFALLKILLGLMAALSITYAMFTFCSSDTMNDGKAESVFFRIGLTMILGVFLLEIFGS